jgi:transcriptional regulator with XRE-family HTH domain
MQHFTIYSHLSIAILRHIYYNVKKEGDSKIMTVGERIKQRRRELKMSAEELGKRLGKNRATIFRYESGFIEKLPIDILEPIAAALNTTPHYLMGWEEEQKKNDIQADIILKMRTDSTFMSVVENLYNLDEEKLQTINQMLKTLFK